MTLLPFSFHRPEDGVVCELNYYEVLHRFVLIERETRSHHTDGIKEMASERLKEFINQAVV